MRAGPGARFMGRSPRGPPGTAARAGRARRWPAPAPTIRHGRRPARRPWQARAEIRAPGAARTSVRRSATATMDPTPRRRVISPSQASRASARCAVSRDTLCWSASSCSLGTRSPAVSWPERINPRSSCASWADSGQSEAGSMIMPGAIRFHAHAPGRQASPRAELAAGLAAGSGRLRRDCRRFVHGPPSRMQAGDLTLVRRCRAGRGRYVPTRRRSCAVGIRGRSAVRLAFP